MTEIKGREGETIGKMSPILAGVYSPQEERILSEGKKSTKRAGRILASFQGARPKIDIERGKYFTESFRYTEGEPLILRWAKALMNYAQNATVYVDDDQLIAGRAGKSGRHLPGDRRHADPGRNPGRHQRPEASSRLECGA